MKTKIGTPSYMAPEVWDDHDARVGGRLGFRVFCV